jgi:hypothetical protein
MFLVSDNLLIHILLGLTLLVTGLLLLRLGLWPKRHGDTPFCAACGYNLTALISDRCPECGTITTPATTVHGERRRRPVVIILGTVFALFGAVRSTDGLRQAARQVDWYRFIPTTYVIADTDSPDTARATAAWWELTKRARSRRLSSENLAALTARALLGQVNTIADSKTRLCINFLAMCHRRGLLTPQQQETFFRQMVSSELRARPRVSAGDAIPYEFTCRWRTPWGFRANLIPRRISVDRDETVLRPDDYRSWTENAAETCTVVQGTTRSSRQGPQTLRLVCEVQIVRSNPGDQPESAPLRREISAAAPVEVLDPAAAPSVTLLTDPALKNKLVACFRPDDFHYDSETESLTGVFHAGELPVSVAFEAFARIDHKEHPIGRIFGRQGEIKTPRYCRCTCPPPGEATIDLILRSSPQVARSTLDLFEIWNGELIFDNVPVKFATTRPAR